MPHKMTTKILKPYMGHIDELFLGIKNFKKLFETFYMDTSSVKASDHLPPLPEMPYIE